MQLLGQSPKIKRRVAHTLVVVVVALAASLLAPANVAAQSGDSEVEASVVGGTGADGANSPWFASLFYGIGTDPICGGTLISASHVVTAAHCVEHDPSSVGQWAVALGLSNTTSPFTTEAVSTITIDPSYLADPSAGRDLAVITLATPVATTPATIYTGAKQTMAAELLGFGCFQPVAPGSENFCPSSTTLQRAATTIYSDLECARDFLSVLAFKWPTQICSVGATVPGTSNSVSGCFGDSGGPLLVGSVGSYRIVGVISQVVRAEGAQNCTGATVAAHLNDGAMAFLASAGVPNLPDIADIKTAARALVEPYRGTSGVEGQVARLYAAYFLRNPDAPGFAFWLTQILSGAWTLFGVSDFFASSPEFEATYGTVDDIVFVWLMYRNLLGREPDIPGFIFWADELLSGRRNRGEVIVGFTESAEIKLLTGTS